MSHGWAGCIKENAFVSFKCVKHVLFVIRNSLQLHKGRCSAGASGVGALHLCPAGPARHVQSDEPVGSVPGEVLLRSDVGSSVAKVNTNTIVPPLIFCILRNDFQTPVGVNPVFIFQL